MSRVKIKCRGPVSKDKKVKHLEILCCKEIHVTKIFDVLDGFAVLTLNEEHVDSIFTKEVRQKLEKYGYQPNMPPELKVKKSVIITRVDDLIYDWKEEEIAEELIRRNEWIGDELDSVIKFPNSTIKVTFAQSSHAKKSTERDLLAFNLSIHPSDIKQETFIPIKCCMKFYTLEDHITREYSKDREYKICSECSTLGHLWHQCKEQFKKCANCGEGYSTLAMKCTMRTNILKEKKKEELERKKNTYAETTRTWRKQKPHIIQPQLSFQTTFTRDDTLKTNMCVAHAHYKNIDDPGTYAEELNTILTLNDLPSVKIPGDPDSELINTNNEQLTSTAVNTTTPYVMSHKNIKCK